VIFYRATTGYFQVGCADGTGVDRLKAEIGQAAAEMLGPRFGLAITYKVAEDRILDRRAKRDTHVNRNELYAIFKRSGISQTGFAEAAARMHSLGLITQFADSVH